jgi:excisionase family DNA binding protein
MCAMPETEETLTTNEAAERLNVTRRAVNAMIRSGKLPATMHGRDYVILASDLAKVEVSKRGRPKTKKKK